MSKNTKVILNKGGSLEHTTVIKNIKVPDLWHIAEALSEGTKIADGPACAKLILEAWQLAQSLHRHIMESP